MAFKYKEQMTKLKKFVDTSDLRFECAWCLVGAHIKFESLLEVIGQRRVELFWH